jgi:hypothetical protein
MGVSMNERGWIEPIVERVVGQVLDSHIAQLRTEIVRRVMEEIAAASADTTLAQSATAGTGTGKATDVAASNLAPAELARAVADIQSGTSQKEILRALLDTSARYAARVALFIVKGSHATGWQARGFENSDAIKDFALDENAAAVVKAIRNRVVAVSPIVDLDSRFLNEFGTPASGEGRILPLILKDKVAALVYADSGASATGSLDAGSLELLVLSTGAWLEVNSLRKQAQAHADSHRTAPDSQPYDAPARSAPPLNDHFAAHIPVAASHLMAAAASASTGDISTSMAASVTAASDMAEESITAESPTVEAMTAVAMTAEVMTAEVEGAVAEPESTVTDTEYLTDSAVAEPLPMGQAYSDQLETVAETQPVSVISSSISSSIPPGDQDVHRKAQRFARLLVDEIKLYNQAKVTEGRKTKDLYDRLQEVIEKSRGTYQKRYGATVAASGNYFQHEIIRSLAEDDLSIMGPNFRQ